MANRLGHDYRLYVASSIGVMNLVAGQTDCTISRPQDLIDITAKTDTLKLRTPGRPDLTISANGFVRTPDPDGLERLYAVMLSQASVVVQVRVTPYGAGDLVYAGSAYVSNIERGMSDQQGATWSCQLTAAAAATTDSIGT
jgi:predicted secreted protein